MPTTRTTISAERLERLANEGIIPFWEYVGDGDFHVKLPDDRIVKFSNSQVAAFYIGAMCSFRKFGEYVPGLFETMSIKGFEPREE